MVDNQSTSAGKSCSVCGKWHSFDEYFYGKRENRSYCIICNKEAAAAYTLGGADAARRYREEKRAIWK